MEIDLEQIGLSEEKLQKKLLKAMAEIILYGDKQFIDEEELNKKLQKIIKNRVDSQVDELATKHVIPQVDKIIENSVFQPTNEWGERKQESMTFKEYLVEICGKWMDEKVSYDGKTKKDSSGYSWKAKQNRMTYIIHSHFHNEIERTMKDALKNANGKIIGGIQETVKIKLKEIADGLKISVGIPE